MESKIKNLHKQKRKFNKISDNLFKTIFGTKQFFYMFLKDFIKEEWVKNLKISDLEIEPTEFADLKGRLRRCDVIYKVRIKNNCSFYIIVILEHQSKIDYAMSIRVTEYITYVYNYMFKNTPKKIREAKGFKLSPVIPIVMYNGSRDWDAELDIRDKINGSNYFASNELISCSYKLVSLNKETVESLSKLKDPLSLIFMLDGAKNSEELEKIMKLSEEYWEELKKALEDTAILDVIASCIENILGDNISFRAGVNNEKSKESLVTTREYIIEKLVKGEVQEMFEQHINFVNQYKSDYLKYFDKYQKIAEKFKQKEEAYERVRKREKEAIRREEEAIRKVEREEEARKREEEARKRELAESVFRICRLRGFKPQEHKSLDDFIKIVAYNSNALKIGLTEFAEEKAIDFKDVIDYIEKS